MLTPKTHAGAVKDFLTRC